MKTDHVEDRRDGPAERRSPEYRHWIAIIFAVGVAWGTAKAVLDGKVDKAVYDRDRSEQAAGAAELLVELKGLRRDVEKLSRYLCNEKPTQLGCQ